jgi:hypothetical protein
MTDEMIVTVTPNTAIERTLFVPSFSLNQTIRASRVVLGMGARRRMRPGSWANWAS